tara:strand:- start:12 stop:359 length:348 start_codon:yes stop_codon:yes gene_type:complete
MEINLKRKIVFEQSSEELYDAFNRKFLNKEEIESDNEHYNVYTDSDTDSDARDISIEDMKELIQKAEDAGANFIQIDYHCDHSEYNIYGSLITRATDEEVNEQKRKEVNNEKISG